MDRAFLDEIFTNNLHVKTPRAKRAKRNCSQFVSQRAERRLTRERETQRAYLKKEEE
jgi:ATP-binding cassette subfamily F protein 3